MRTSNLVIAALILALAAAGILIWTNQVDLGQFTQSSPPPPSSNNNVEWTKRMAQLATPEGIAASFDNVTSWSITDGHRLERFSYGGPNQTFARLSSGEPLDPNNRLSGLQLKLPLAWAQKANGKKIEIGIVARQPQSNSASDVSVLYATLQAGNSGWHTFKLSPTFAVSKFEFDVPLVEGGYQSEPTVVIRSDSLGGERAVELIGIYLKPLS
jgi:hypothetical protein